MKPREFKNYPDDALLSSAEIQQMMDISRPTFQKHEKQSGFPAPIILGTKIKRWYKRDIDQWLRSYAK